MSDDNSGEVLAKLIVGGMLVAGAVAVTGKVIRSLSNKEESDLTDRIEPTSKPVIVEEPIQQSCERENNKDEYKCLGCHRYFKLSKRCATHPRFHNWDCWYDSSYDS